MFIRACSIIMRSSVVGVLFMAMFSLVFDYLLPQDSARIALPHVILIPIVGVTIGYFVSYAIPYYRELRLQLIGILGGAFIGTLIPFSTSSDISWIIGGVSGGVLGGLLAMRRPADGLFGRSGVP
jgi:hypothetical protein